MEIKDALGTAALPEWAGWVTAGFLALAWIVREVLGVREKRAAFRNVEAATLKMQLDMLNESAAARLRELQVIQNVLNLEPQPDAQALAALETSQNPVGTYAYQHVKSRSEARSQLPLTIDRLMALQARRVQLESEVALGVETTTEVEVASQIGRASCRERVF